MKCPICKKEFSDTKYKPFCSKRCADIDLGNWFNEKYSFPVENLNEETNICESMNDLLQKDESDL